MATEIGLPRIRPDELRVRAMAHYQENVRTMADRERKRDAEREVFDRTRAAAECRYVLHLEREGPVGTFKRVDPSRSFLGTTRRVYEAVVDELTFRVLIKDGEPHAIVALVLPCGGNADHVDHEWPIDGPAQLGELLTDPPSHADWDGWWDRAVEARNPTSTSSADGTREPVTPEQHLLDAVRLFIHNEIEGD